FLWSEDMADACVYIMSKVDFSDLTQNKREIRNTHINIGSGEEISVKELAIKVKEISGFKGDLYFNSDKPDGTMRKLTDSSKLNKLGWNYAIGIDEGIKQLLTWYLN
ncbi:MAG: GDP-L-fucose synthase, partial [Flavobacteriaceae bacterium]|nr:GDP-L-fucose synthase [Flavobacteriaceae bacterium]